MSQTRLKKFKNTVNAPVSVDLGLLAMFKHRVAGNISAVAFNFHALIHDALIHIVVFTSPAPELVRESIDFDELSLGQGTDSPKNGLVWKPAKSVKFEKPGNKPTKQTHL